MLSRRQFLKMSALAGAGFFLPRNLTRTNFLKLVTFSSLDPTTIPKYVTPLVIPPVMPKVSEIQGVDYYEIAMKQFTQQVLPSSLPKTTVWSYGAANQPSTLNFPAFTIEATVDKPVRVKWINGLVDENNNYLPHLLPVDPTLHWANPPGPRDIHPHFSSTPSAYTGPVPIVTHVHGAHVSYESDGYPEAWYLPAAADIPSGYFTTGSIYDEYKSIAEQKYGQAWDAGSAVYQYANDHRATTLWYHDHALGITRLNVYAGPAGFFLMRGGSDDLPQGVLPGPAPQPGDQPGTAYYEIPIAIQDRSFNADGSLFYPDSRLFFDEFDGPYYPDSDVSPIWNPEFFPNTIVVNGNTWPYLNVEPRRYRLRFLNGCQSRTLLLRISDSPDTRPASTALPFWQIGSEGGFLPAPVQLNQLLMGPAERADVIVDFSQLSVGTSLYLINEGPDEPFNGHNEDVADPTTTGQVMKFTVVPLSGTDTSIPPDQLTLPNLTPLGEPMRIRQVSLNEMDSMELEGVGPTMAMLGTLSDHDEGIPKSWMDPITETPTVGDTEIWEIHNFTMDAHPIHLHQVEFQVVNRQHFEGGQVQPPEAWETGYKDTVIVYPDGITRIKAKFDLPGLYVWHCHILEHEDNEMMRPYKVYDTARFPDPKIYLPYIFKP